MSLTLLASGCEETPRPAGNVPRDAPADSVAGAASESGAPSAPNTPPRLTADGWGDLHIGMTRAEVVAAFGEDANPGAVGGPEPEFCDEFRPEGIPDRTLLMFEDGVLTRITLSAGAEIQSEDEISVGDPAERVRGASGSAFEESPHKYWPAPAAYLTRWTRRPPDPEPRGIVYEIGPEETVVHIHAGGASIQYVEGCL